MGEYINYKDKEIKLGTCEDLYYVRHSQLANKNNSFGNTGDGGVNTFLDYKQGFRYRFPFIDEDSIEPGQFKDHNKAQAVTVPRYYAQQFEHGTITTRTKPRDASGYSHNVFLPCTESDLKEYPVKIDTTFKNRDTSIIEVVQQKLDPTGSGDLQVVVRCWTCGAMARLDYDDAKVFASYAEDLSPELAKRILAGYKSHKE
jgi:hypothetical protein